MKKFLATAAAFIALSSPVHATPITLNVHDADLKSTIMFVARAGNLNVSVDDSVGGNISISLSNVEPRKILEIIAKTKNLNLVQDGEIFIMTSQFSGSALMNSYLLPIKFGDAETLRKAVIPIATVTTKKKIPKDREFLLLRHKKFHATKEF